MNSYEKEIFLNNMISKDIEFFNRNYDDSKAEARNLRFICRNKEKAIRNKNRLMSSSAKKSGPASAQKP